MSSDENAVTPRYPEGRRVYVIEILPKWYGVAASLNDEPIGEGHCVFYVGETGLYICERYVNQRTGYKAGRIFKKIRREIKETGAEDLTLEDSVDTRLRQDLAAGVPDGLTRDEALKEESALAASLAAQGHTVFSN